ncbi:MAG: LysM peptidoglycan-binding domain-containing protein [Ruminococcaceae bacterium]|nr:LysM peptidoglycan-binding domain-containing protein [Oscillospiraceae bacterium]
MHIQFNNMPLRCMRQILTQTQAQELTQEVKLPDGYPDIGRILSCRGQIVLRGKEWRRTAMSANGGVMVWVLYAPEDGSEARCLDAWMPFQTRWELPDAVDDGVVTVMPLLSELDGRNISARKIILRAGIELQGQAMEYCKMEIPTPTDVPEDIQLLLKTYPVELPMEAGERQVRIEESLSIPDDQPPIARMIGYELVPTIQEQKVLANRLVLRGSCTLQLRYLCEDGKIHNWKTELPMSDYTELRNEYDTTATAWLLPTVTALELDQGEGQLQLRAGVAAQYTVFDRTVLKVAEDAYSPYRQVDIQQEMLQLPVLLDRRELEIPVTVTVPNDLQEVVDLSVLCRQPYVSTEENGVSLTAAGQFLLLGSSSEEMALSDSVNYEENMLLPGAKENHIELWPGIITDSSCAKYGGDSSVHATLPVTAFSYTSEPIRMLGGIEVGEQKQSDPQRPSVILKQTGEEDLWTLAKRYGSTVEAIREANHLDGDEQLGSILLIPVC